MTINSVTFSGHLGGDPEILNSSNSEYARFSLAVKVYDKGENTTMWLKCFVFGNKSNVVGEYLRKGDMVTISGKLKENVYQDNNGNEIRSLSVIVNDFTLPSNNGSGNRSNNGYNDPGGDASF